MNPISVALGFFLCLGGLGLGGPALSPSGSTHPLLALPFFAAALLVGLSLKIADSCQTFVILRAGKRQRVRGPGMFLMIPFIDRVVAVIDERMESTAFSAEQARTKDGVAVTVDAIPIAHPPSNRDDRYPDYRFGFRVVSPSPSRAPVRTYLRGDAQRRSAERMPRRETMSAIG